MGLLSESVNAGSLAEQGFDQIAQTQINQYELKNAVRKELGQGLGAFAGLAAGYAGRKAKDKKNDDPDPNANNPDNPDPNGNKDGLGSKKQPSQSDSDSAQSDIDHDPNLGPLVGNLSDFTTGGVLGRDTQNSSPDIGSIVGDDD